MYVGVCGKGSYVTQVKQQSSISPHIFQQPNWKPLNLESLNLESILCILCLHLTISVSVFNSKTDQVFDNCIHATLILPVVVLTNRFILLSKPD